MARALAAGGIYHEQITETMTAGSHTMSIETERWSDVKHRRVQTDTTTRASATAATQHRRTVTVAGASFADGNATDAPSCFGADAVTSTVLGCVGDTNEPTRVDVVSRGGHWFYEIVDSFDMPLGEDDASVVRRVAVDAATWLPAGAQMDGSINGGGRFRVDQNYSATFVKPQAVPPGTFATPPPVKASNLPTYWLGKTWSPGGGNPAMTVTAAELPEDPGGPASIIGYAVPGQEAQGPAMTVLTQTYAGWHKWADKGDPPCRGTRPEPTAGGTATYYCSEPPVHVSVSVALGNLVVSVGTAEGPLNTIAVLRRAVLALRRR